MRLELADFPVKDVKFGKRTGYNGGVLEIDKEEMAALVLQDSRVTCFDLDVAFPGEKTRVANVRHVTEPRVKVSEKGCVFPGVMGPVETVGEGRTHKLSGVTVVSSVDRQSTIPSGTAAQDSSVLDMWGPGAEMRSGMARAVSGGMISSTVLTLVVVPIVYTVVDDIVGLFRRKKKDPAAVEPAEMTL